MVNYQRTLLPLVLIVSLSNGCSTIRKITATEEQIDTVAIAERAGVTELFVPTASCEVGVPVTITFPDYESRESTFQDRMTKWKQEGGTHWLTTSQTVKVLEGKLYKCSPYAGVKKEVVYEKCAESLKMGGVEACSDYLGFLKVEDDPELFAVLGERLCREKDYWFCQNVPHAKVRAAQIAKFRRESAECLDRNVTQVCLNLAHQLGSSGAYSAADQFAAKACSLGNSSGCSMQTAYIEKARLAQEKEIAADQIRNANMRAAQQMENDFAISRANASAASYQNGLLINAVNQASRRPTSTRCISRRTFSGQVQTDCN